MTIQELNLFAKDIITKAEAAELACSSVVAIAKEVANATEQNKPLGLALEQLIGSGDKIAEYFTPDYINALKAAEVALDALGSDALNDGFNLPK